MKIRQEMGWFFGVASFVLSSVTSSVGWADSGDILSKFHPYITVREEYNNNIDLTATNKKSDFITTVSPGLKLSTSEKTYGIDLDFNAGFNFYAKEEDNNYISLLGNLNTWYALTPRLSFRVRDYLIRSDENREPDYSVSALEGTYLTSRTFRRVPYTRNVFEPSVEYQYGKKEDLISINYRNNLYNTQSQVSEDSVENYINPRFTHWFDIRNGISLEYGLTLGDFQRSSDLVGQMATGRYTYRFNPKTSIFGEYTQMWRNFDGPRVDYIVYRPSIGIEHAFTPTLTGKVQGGYYRADPTKGSALDGPFYDITVTQQAQRTTYTLGFQGGYTEDFFTSENRGFTQYHRALGRVSHQFLRRVNVGLYSSYEWNKNSGSLILSGRETDRIWTIGGNAGYQILKWLTLSLDLSHRENHSNIDAADYSEYRGMLSITATYNK